LFVAPGVAAYFFYSHPSWLGASRTNNGTLLTKPVQLSSVTGEHKWRLLFWAPATCDAACFTQLDRLARVRLALGRKLYLVDQMLLLGEEPVPPGFLNRDEIKTKDFKVLSLSAVDQHALMRIPDKPQIFIMNPDNYLVLSYKVGAKPNAIYNDLKLLTSTTEIKQG
jgi:hypothetical protein